MHFSISTFCQLYIIHDLIIFSDIFLFASVNWAFPNSSLQTCAQKCYSIYLDSGQWFYMRTAKYLTFDLYTINRRYRIIQVLCIGLGISCWSNIFLILIKSSKVIANIEGRLIMPSRLRQLHKRCCNRIRFLLSFYW